MGTNDREKVVIVLMSTLQDMMSTYPIFVVKLDFDNTDLGNFADTDVMDFDDADLRKNCS